MGLVKDALSQSDCRILKSVILQEKIDESILYLACSYRFKKHKSWFVSFWLGEVKNAVSQSDCRILESTIFKVRIDEQTWFFGIQI